MKKVYGYLLMSLALGVQAGTAVADMVSEERSSHLIQVREADTLEQLAQSYLGDATLSGELLRANRLTTDEWQTNRPPVIWVGPGLREQAMAAIIRCADALEAAKNGQAERFASHEYAQAKRALGQASKALDGGAYGVAFEVALWGANRSHEAMLQARTAALTPEEGELSEVGQGVVLSYDKGKSWQEVAEGGQVPAGTLVKNDSQQPLIISLPMQASAKLFPGGLLFIDTLQMDQRDFRREMQARLDAGSVELSGPRGDTPVAWSLRSQSAHFSGEAVAVRCDVEKKRVKWSCIDGRGLLKTKDTEQSLAKGHSLWVSEKGAVDGPYAHPAVPVLAQPEQGSRTASQLPLLSWSSIDGASIYRVSLQLDGAEAEKDWDTQVKDSKVRVGPLPGGTYSWQVQAVDARGLESGWTALGAFTVALNYDLEMQVEGRYMEKGGLLYSGKQAIYTFRPAAASSSVETIEVQRGDGPWMTLEDDPARLTFSESGEYQFAVRGVGLDGKFGKEMEHRVLIDADGPRVRVHLSEPLDFPGEGMKAALAIRCDDPAGVSEVKVRLDGEDIEGPTDFLLLTMNERHKIEVTSTDGWGNQTTKYIRSYPDGRLKIKD